MNINEACGAIIGDELAMEITLALGVHWARVAAMAEAKEGDDPEARRVLREWQPPAAPETEGEGESNG